MVLLIYYFYVLKTLIYTKVIGRHAGSEGLSLALSPHLLCCNQNNGLLTGITLNLCSVELN
jgi:hypothetical protein